MISEAAAHLQNIVRQSIASSHRTTMIFYAVGVIAYNEARTLRRICNSQSVIVFHVTRANADATMPGKEQLLTMRLLRKLLPTLHRYVHNEDILSIMSTCGITSTKIVAVLNTDRAGAELAAQRLREVMMVQRIPLKHNGYTRLLVSYHAVSFAL